MFRQALFMLVANNKFGRCSCTRPMQHALFLYDLTFSVYIICNHPSSHGHTIPQPICSNSKSVAISLATNVKVVVSDDAINL
jgi:hypothetical protein